MTRIVQTGQRGAPLLLSLSSVIVHLDGVQTGQPTNYMCPLRFVHVRGWVANAKLVLVLCCWVIQNQQWMKSRNQGSSPSWEQSVGVGSSQALCRALRMHQLVWGRRET